MSQLTLLTRLHVLSNLPMPRETLEDRTEGELLIYITHMMTFHNLYIAQICLP